MAGALLQLVAYGAQDVNLTGNPQITFFKAVYRRHTNFAIESMKQILNGRADFGNKVSCRLARNGDLVGACYVQATLPALTASSQIHYCNRVGFRLLRQVQLRIGGQLIDEQSATWMHCWTELSCDAERKTLLDKLVSVKRADGGTIHPDVVDARMNANNTLSDRSNTVWNALRSPLAVNVPLQFSFCRNPGLALPLIALQYHEVELSIELESFQNCLALGSRNVDNVTTQTVGSLSNVALYVDYYFLDTEERKEFAQNPHEYLIETTQEMTSDVTGGAFPNQLDLTFNHPVKELVWVVRRDRGTPVTQSINLFANAPGPNFANAIGGGEATNVNFEVGETNQKNVEDLLGANVILLPTNTITFANAEGGNGETTPTFQNVGIGASEIAQEQAAEADHVIGTVTRFTGDVFTNYTSDSAVRVIQPNTVRVQAIAGPKQFAVVNNTGVGEGGAIVTRAATTAEINAVIEGNNTLVAGLNTTGTTNTCSEARLLLNGQERFVGRNGLYFNGVQPYQHHTGNPDIGINCYSFAINPEDHQPSGTCNFSRVDNASLEIVSEVNGQATVMAHGYNVLRVASGMGGLAYSN